VFPSEQLDDRGRLVGGLKEVLPLFDDGYAAWVWLTTPLPALDDETPPSKLREVALGKVLEVARGDARGDFA
jgi:hypothetical protein